ncbi:methylmalonyl-CoA mutase family protein [Nocardioides sp. T2.26MG-1]|uniref:methylmalonyl-CoA mutase family protein n=1 Tax=Nocardioides sp. T2.26MG-1 TaxID=3041166 RepID=UPI002477977B|nr:methylmalonyl-CoA mutase family protein [Nocardioides sp. T2.26MG-1]CAI9405428.1 putative methylmalonyl-CoA mutase small subunit [Nocardioides sp. T2.26MG-1]
MSVDGGVEGGLDEPAKLEPEQGSLDLASPEDAWTIADWEKGAAAVLRKARRLTEEDPDDLVWQKLTRTTLDGIGITPLGTRALLDDVATHGRPVRQGDWDVRSFVEATDAKAANGEALNDLEGGVTSLWLRGGTDLPTALDGVKLDLAPVVLDGVDPAAFLLYAEGRELHPATNLGVPAAEATAEVARQALDRHVLGFVVDATTVHDRGASDAQELASSMAAGVTYLRALGAAGVPVEQAAQLVEFRYAATDEQFPTIAKLRAARRLWARVLELSESPDVPQRQHVVTSRPMMTRYDPYVNMLRTTVAAFAAGVGGADAVTVLSFDSPLGRPEQLGRRIARNISHLLIDEAHVAHVVDPAGGSYAVEKLTDDLALVAWELFGKLDAGESLDEAIAATVAKRAAEIARRKRPITGLSEFPNGAEVLPDRVAWDAWDGVQPYGAAFEALRDAPAATPVFLATLGAIATHTARATFATNLFAAGGIAVEVAGATADPPEVVAAYAGQPVVCLAGADSTYAEWGAEAAAALRAAGAQHVIIAGKPTDYTDDSCALGVDALDFLTRTREKLS